MRATVFDRVVAAVSPDWGVQRLKSRMQFDALASLPSAEADVGSGFDTTGGVGDTGRDDGGSRSWRPRPRDARSDSVRALPLQRGQSRDLARTSPTAGGPINTNFDRVVDTGLALGAQRDAPASTSARHGWVRCSGTNTLRTTRWCARCPGAWRQGVSATQGGSSMNCCATVARALWRPRR